MKRALLLVAAAAFCVLLVPEMAEAQRVTADWLYTAPVLGSGPAVCSAVNIGPSPMKIELAIFDALGVQLSVVTYAGLTCGDMAPNRVCAVQIAPGQVGVGVRPVHCRIAIVSGRRDNVRGALADDILIGEAR